MFLSFAPQVRRRESFVPRLPLCTFDDEDDDDISLLDDIVRPLSLFAVLNNKNDYTRRRPLKRKVAQREIAPIEKRKRFEVDLDVEGYKPNELDVKLSEDDNILTIRGSHEEEDENGHVIRHFTREFTIPEDVHLEELTCNLNAKKNVIQLSAPLKVKQPEVKERVIPITLTSSPRRELQNSQNNAVSQETKDDQTAKKADENQQLILNKHSQPDATSAA